MWSRGIRAYLYSSAHIALVGGFSYYFLNSTERNCRKESIFIGLCIYIYYNISRIFRINNYNAIQANPHLVWVSKNLTELIFSLGFAILFLFLIGHKLSIKYPILGLLILLSGLYLLLREKLIIKNCIIAMSWCLTFSLFGQAYYYAFAFFLALSLWYDFKDEYPYHRSKICLYIAVLTAASCIFAFTFHYDWQMNLLIIAIYLFLFFLTLKVRKEYFYLFIVDMTILFPAILYYILVNS